jgi:hypothetical protein
MALFSERFARAKEFEREYATVSLDLYNTVKRASAKRSESRDIFACERAESEKERKALIAKSVKLKTREAHEAIEREVKGKLESNMSDDDQGVGRRRLLREDFEDAEEANLCRDDDKGKDGTGEERDIVRIEVEAATLKQKQAFLEREHEMDSVKTGEAEKREADKRERKRGKELEALQNAVAEKSEKLESEQHQHERFVLSMNADTEFWIEETERRNDKRTIDLEMEEQNMETLILEIKEAREKLERARENKEKETRRREHRNEASERTKRRIAAQIIIARWWLKVYVVAKKKKKKKKDAASKKKKGKAKKKSSSSSTGKKK